MTPRHIYTLSRWFKCTESDIFNVAFAHRYGMEAGMPSHNEIVEYAEDGVIPKYLRDYILNVVYPQICIDGGPPCRSLTVR